ncbi:uncharacterized protein PAC_09037 [Phialocephala subalpina]|uniref:Uncharacterized protein n=1 Tax=Phialocephala subalpina TaxID=576137 RepID=A0A1L7X293_9HELO|nr:uncharacterized protein PAC_09037 [Phialocephala subalpina]
MPGTLSRKAARKLRNQAELQANLVLANQFSPDAGVHVPEEHAGPLNVPSVQRHCYKGKAKVEHYELVVTPSSSEDESKTPSSPSSDAGSQPSPPAARTSPINADEKPMEANSPAKAAEKNASTAQASPNTSKCLGEGRTLPQGVLTYPQALLVSEQCPREPRTLPVAHRVLSRRGAHQAENDSNYFGLPGLRKSVDCANVPSINGLLINGSGGTHTNHFVTTQAGQESNSGNDSGENSANAPRDQGQSTNTRHNDDGEEDPDEPADDPTLVTDTQATLGSNLTLFEHEWHYPTGGLYVSANLKCLRSVPVDGGEMVLMAINFVFHAASNIFTRVSAARIKIIPYQRKDRDTVNVRKIPYFSPKAVLGKYSRESLTWQFCPGELRRRLLLSMLMIDDNIFSILSLMMMQGSVRSHDGLPQSSVEWTVEEDSEQRSGIPTDFTFSLAVLQTVARAPFELYVEIVPIVIYLSAEGIPSTNLQYRHQICNRIAQYSSTLNWFQFGGESLPASDDVQEQLNT